MGLAYSGILWHILAYSGILLHTLAYSCIFSFCHTLAYPGILWHILAFSCIVWHTLAYFGVPLPCGQYMAIFSSVRSSYSHPGLLVITTTPLFQITPVLNTGLSLSEPLQLYKG